MSSKWIGALLILWAGGLLITQLFRQGREELLFLQEMASALEQMESAIRFRRLPMPELLEEQAKRPCCGMVFSVTLQYMKRGKALQESWDLSAQSIPWAHPSQILSALELSGDGQRISENLRSCAGSLRAVLQRKQADRRQKQKMSLALTASCCGLLVILLL